MLQCTKQFIWLLGPICDKESICPIVRIVGNLVGMTKHFANYVVPLLIEMNSSGDIRTIVLGSKVAKSRFSVNNIVVAVGYMR